MKRDGSESVAPRITLEPHIVRVQCVVFGADLNRQPPELEVLVSDSGHSTISSRPGLVLPGGLVEAGEMLEESASRVLKDLAGIRDVYLEQLYTFDPDREGIVRVAYYALVNRSGKDASSGSWWCDISKFIGKTGHPPLVLRDMNVLATALSRLRSKVRYEPIGFSMLPERFTMPQLRGLYEAILGESIDDRNFSKKMLGMGVLRRVNVTTQGKRGQGRPAFVYEFDDKTYERLAKRGWSFEI